MSWEAVFRLWEELKQDVSSKTEQLAKQKERHKDE